jgi:hypothetical protein
MHKQDFIRTKEGYTYYAQKPEKVGTNEIDIGISEGKIKKASRHNCPIKVVTDDYGVFYINSNTKPNRTRTLDRGYKMVINWYRFNVNREQDEFDLL